MQNMLNVVMRRAGTDKVGKPRPPRVAMVLTDGTEIEVLVEAAGPTAAMGKSTDGREMIIPYSSIRYILP